jgi:hypothetical protein
MSILVIDNGAGNIKAGLDHFEQPLSIANVTGKIPKSMQYLVSDQVYDSRSDSQLSLSRSLPVAAERLGGVVLQLRDGASLGAAVFL